MPMKYDLYCCRITIQHRYKIGPVTVGHILRELSNLILHMNNRRSTNIAKQFLKRLESVPLYDYQNMVFQLLENGPWTIIRSSENCKRLRDIRSYQEFFNKLIKSPKGSTFLFFLPLLGRPPNNRDQANLRITGCTISRKVVISVRNDILTAKCPKTAKKWSEYYFTYQLDRYLHRLWQPTCVIERWNFH